MRQSVDEERDKRSRLALRKLSEGAHSPPPSMGWSPTSGHVPLATAQTRSPKWIILGLLVLCINTKLTSADGKEFTGKSSSSEINCFDNSRNSDDGNFRLTAASACD